MSSRPPALPLPPLDFIVAVGAGAATANVRLEVADAGQSAGDAVAQALALAPLLPLLTAVQAWLDAPIAQLHPAATALPWPSEDEAMTLALPGRGRLALPWPLLRTGHVLDVDGTAVEWPLVACELLIESLAADRIDARDVAPGAVLLLPASFAAADVRLPLRARPPRGWPLLAGLTWRPRHDTLALSSAPDLQDDAAAADHAPWTVVSAEPLPLSAAWWFGAGPAQTLTAPRRASLRCAGRALAHGRLVPAGAGMGLLIEHGESAAVAA